MVKMVQVGPDGVPAAMEWLAEHGQGPIFLYVNLHRHGLARDNGHPHAVDLWQGKGGLIGLTRAGVLMPQMALANDADWRAAGVALAGRAIGGVIADARQTGRAQRALGLTDAPADLDRVEQAYRLDLARMVTPATAGLTLRPITTADADLASRWHADYRVEIMGADPATAPDATRKIVEDWIAADSHRLLWRGDAPVALTGFNARLPGLVQIGGVYTPPELRGQGLARAALALHLAEARAQGVTHACLFAASDIAARAYAAIGFTPAGQVHIVIHSAPAKVPA